MRLLISIINQIWITLDNAIVINDLISMDGRRIKLANRLIL